MPKEDIEKIDLSGFTLTRWDLFMMYVKAICLLPIGIIYFCYSVVKICIDAARARRTAKEALKKI